MADVNFYVQQHPKPQGELAFRLCRRVAIQAKQKLLVLLPTDRALAVFDDLLWTFEADSFLPHSTSDINAPIFLSQTVPTGFKGHCLNLTSTAIDATLFERVLELITNSESAKAIGREKFMAYRAAGIQPSTHHV